MLARVTRATGRVVQAIDGAYVQLFRHSEMSGDSLFAQGPSADDRPFRVDTLPSGVYFVRARAIGFRPLGETVRVRQGERIELEFQMRTDSRCLEQAREMPDGHRT